MPHISRRDGTPWLNNQLAGTGPSLGCRSPDQRVTKKERMLVPSELDLVLSPQHLPPQYPTPHNKVGGRSLHLMVVPSK